jgi:hypothetical protein
MSNTVEFILTLKDLLTGKLKEADAEATKLEKSMHHVAEASNHVNEAIKKIGGIIAGAYVVDKVTEFIGESREAYEQIEFANSQLQAGLKSTQSQAGVTFDGMVESAKKFAHEMKFTRGQVEGVQGVLLTFPAVSKDIFDRTTQAALDMATRMKGDPQASILQLGKALQDPERGITALGRAGVNVDELKKKFETVTDTVERQKLILKELEGEFGGSAKAAAEADAGFRRTKTIEEMKDSLGELADKIEESLSPALEWIASVGMQAIDKLSELWTFISKNVDFGAIANNIKMFANAVYNFFEPLFTPIKNLFASIYNGIMLVWDTLAQFSSEGEGILGGLQTALGWIIDGFSWLFSAVSKFVASVIDVLHTIYVLLEKIGVIWVIKKAFELVWSFIKLIGGMIKSIYETSLKPILDAIEKAYQKVKKLLGIKDVKVTAENKVEVKSTEDKEMTGKDLITQGAEKMPAMTAMPEMTKPKTGGGEASKVSGSKSTTINIQIGKLIEQFKVSTTTVGEGASQIKEKVAQTLLGAINDSQIVAGI